MLNLTNYSGPMGLVFIIQRHSYRMQPDERIQAHLVSVWGEATKFLSGGGKEMMLILTDRHLMFVRKTKAKSKWWEAIRQRQILGFLRSKNTMIVHDGYTEKNLMEDLEDEKNAEVLLDEILDMSYKEKEWGSVLLLEYNLDGKKESYEYSIAQDWVKYPVKAPTKFLKVDWEPFVQFIRDRQRAAR